MNVGTFMIWPSNNIPPDCIKASGQLLSISLWPELFSVLGTTYGGDGISTFGLPKPQGRGLRHIDGGTNRDPDKDARLDRGDGTTGDAIGTLQADAYQKHRHATWTGRNSTANGSFPRMSTATGSGASYTTTTGTGTQTHPNNINMYLIVKAKP